MQSYHYFNSANPLYSKQTVPKIPKMFQHFHKLLLAAILLGIYHQSEAQQVTLYEDGQYQGRSKQVSVSRCQNLFDFRALTSSIKTTGCVMLYSDQCCQSRSYQVPGNIDALWGFNDLAVSISPCGNYRAPLPTSIRETWLGHDQTMTKVAEDGDIAIYYNSAVKQTAVNNHRDYLKRLWAYVKTTYGSNFGPEGGRVNAFMHASSPYGGGNSVQVYFDGPSECRNLIDVSTSDPNGWSAPLTGPELDVLTHEMSHIVEGANNGVHFSPAYFLWQDSSWAEIFNYDVYYALGLTQERNRWFQLMQNSKHNKPYPNTYWFRDWHYPIYSQNGGARLFSSFFRLCAQYFPRRANGWQYADRTMNVGELVHFFSGAAGRDLKSQGMIAFPWGANEESQLQRAKQEFNQIRY